MLRYSLLLITALLLKITCIAQTPDWSTGVAPIIYNHCATCHRDGGIAPFSLMDYSDEVANAFSIKNDVTIKKMPPWPPDPNYSRFAHERLLSDAEINTIVNWVDSGTPEGDTSLAPPKPTFSNSGDLPGTPDFVGTIPTYTSTASTGDVYQCFVIPSGLLTDKYITAFEAVPSNRGIVHHVLVFADTTGVCRHLDSLNPGPGYTDFGGVGTNKAILLGGWVPGSAPIQLPTGFGERLPKNADIVLQIHYPAGTAGQKDSTQVHFFFAPTTTGIRDVFIQPVLNYLTNINTPLYIPANTTRTFTEQYKLPSYLNVSMLGVAPHMHLIGKKIYSFGVTPTGDTLNFIRINNWDFHWQGFYMFQKLTKIPASTTVYANAFYDNTTANGDNPSDPPKDVYGGDATTDEMMLVYFVYTYYQPGDENIVIDSTTSISTIPVNYYRGQQLLDPYPNPANNNLVIKCYFNKPDIGSIDLIDINGKCVSQLMNQQKILSGYSTYTYSVAELPTGVYTLLLRTSERILTKKVIIQH